MEFTLRFKKGKIVANNNIFEAGPQKRRKKMRLEGRLFVGSRLTEIKEVVTEDEISRINQELLTWAGFIEKNEQEKLEATELVKRYDFDGRANIQYSETFTTSTSESRYMKLPFISGLAGGIPGASALSKLINQDKSREKSTYDDRYGWDFTGVNVEVFNLKLELKFSIVLGADYNYAYGKTETFSKKAGFTLACSNKSSLLVDVYQAGILLDADRELMNEKHHPEIRVFLSSN